MKLLELSCHKQLIETAHLINDTKLLHTSCKRLLDYLGISSLFKIKNLIYNRDFQGGSTFDELFIQDQHHKIIWFCSLDAENSYEIGSKCAISDDCLCSDVAGTKCPIDKAVKTKETIIMFPRNHIVIIVPFENHIIKIVKAVDNSTPTESLKQQNYNIQKSVTCI